MGSNGLLSFFFLPCYVSIFRVIDVKCTIVLKDKNSNLVKKNKKTYTECCKACKNIHFDSNCSYVWQHTL